MAGNHKLTRSDNNQLKQLARQIRSIPHLTIEAQADKDGFLHGSVGALEIAEAFQSKGVNVLPEQICLEGPIKECALYEVRIDLGKGIHAQVQVMVVPSRSMRAYQLAKELNIRSRDLVEICQRAGLDVKNQLTQLTEAQCQQVEKLVRNRKPDAAEKLTMTIESQYPGISRLMQVGENADIGNLEIIPKLADIDPEAALFKIRKLGERLCRKVAGVNGRATFHNMIQDIETRQLLSAKTINLLHHMRDLGNFAVHPSDDPFDEMCDADEVNYAASALAKVLNELLERKVIVT